MQKYRYISKNTGLWLFDHISVPNRPVVYSKMPRMYFLRSLNRNFLKWMTITMATRSTHMKKVNIQRSAEVAAMIDFLSDLDNGTGGDYDGFDSFGIESSVQLRSQINSYRAGKIAKLLDKNLNKNHLKRFIKDHGYNYSMTAKEVIDFVNSNLEGLMKYWEFSKGFYINNALMELDKEENCL